MTVKEYENLVIGEVEKVGYASFTINPETFAPGIWAGLEDKSIVINKNSEEITLDITYIDYEDQVVHHKVDESGPYFYPGDILTIKKMSIEDGR